MGDTKKEGEKKVPKHLVLHPDVRALFNAKEGTWSTHLACKWRHPETCITVVEGESVIATMKTLAGAWNTTPRAHAPAKVVWALDSSALLGAVSKGRSSSFQLNRICQKIAALTVACSIRVGWLWVDSKSNPADIPSRIYAPQALRPSTPCPPLQPCTILW